MSKKKRSGLWWKVLVAGTLLAFLAVTLGFYAGFQKKPEAERYVRFNTGSEVTFELKEGRILWLEETNFGLGSSPGSISDPAKTVRLYDPKGQQIPLSEERHGDEGSSDGTFDAPGPGTYKLVANSVGKPESHGRLRGRRPYSFYRTVCDVCFFYVLPLVYY